MKRDCFEQDKDCIECSELRWCQYADDIYEEVSEEDNEN